MLEGRLLRDAVGTAGFLQQARQDYAVGCWTLARWRTRVLSNLSYSPPLPRAWTSLLSLILMYRLYRYYLAVFGTALSQQDKIVETEFRVLDFVHAFSQTQELFSSRTRACIISLPIRMKEGGFLEITWDILHAEQHASAAAAYQPKRILCVDAHVALAAASPRRGPQSFSENWKFCLVRILIANCRCPRACGMSASPNRDSAGSLEWNVMRSTNKMLSLNNNNY